MASRKEFDGNPLELTTCRSKLAPPMRPHLDPIKVVNDKQWIGPVRISMDGGIPRDPLTPMIKGHFWLEGQRRNLVGTGGPLLWPLRVPKVEVWKCQGRTEQAFTELLDQGRSEQEILVDGNGAIGGQVAAALAGYVAFQAGRKAVAMAITWAMSIWRSCSNGWADGVEASYHEDTILPVEVAKVFCWM